MKALTPLAILVLMTSVRSRVASGQCTGCPNASFGPGILSLPNIIGGPIALGDLNGDGNIDLVSTGSINLGTGTGHFVNAGTFYAGSGSVAVALADVNNDGILDIVVANQNDNDIAVLLGDGTGSVGAPVAFPAGPQPASLTIADFNGDGYQDIFCLNPAANGASLLLGNGDGTFQPANFFPAGAAPAALALGDVNGDGFPDVAVLNAGSSDITLLAGTPYGGLQIDGTVPLPQGVSSLSLALADFNGDGKMDIAIGTTGGIWLLLGNGEGSFTPNSFFPLDWPSAIIAVDFDGDGLPDLAATDLAEDFVNVLKSHPDGSFTFLGEYGVGSGPTYLGTSDLNGDGIPDLVVGHTSFSGPSVLIGKGDGTFNSPTMYQTGGGAAFVLTTDLNGDGLADLILGNTYSSTVSLLLGVGDGTFSQFVPLGTGPSPSAGVAADFNGDGNLDLVIASDAGLQLFPGNGDGSFQLPIAISFVTDPLALATGDFNRDGIPDLAVTDTSNNISVLLGNGDGSFQPPDTSSCLTDPVAVVVADLNGDGVPDLAIVGSLSDSVGIRIGKGDGTFLPEIDYAAGPNPSSLTIADLNGDGILDLAVADQGLGAAPAISLLLGIGDGSFQNATTVPGPAFPIAIAAGDFNQDGKTDLAIAGSDDNTAGILIGNGDGTFRPMVAYNVAGLPTCLATADFTGDGKPDIVVGSRENANTVTILLNSNCIPNQLRATSQPSSCNSPSTPFATQPSIAVSDDGDNVVGCETGPVTVSIVPDTGTSGATLSGTNPVFVTQGVGSFTNLSIDLAGRGYRLTYNYPGVRPTTSRSMSQGLTVGITGPSTYCQGSTITEEAGSNYDTYSWLLDGYPIAHSRHCGLVGLTPGQHTLEVDVTQDGCIASATTVVTAYSSPPAPAIDAIPIAQIGATGLTASIIAPTGTVYHWTLTGGQITSGQGTDIITFDAGAPGTTMVLEAFAVSQEGCTSAPATIAIQVDFSDVPPSNPFRVLVDSVARNGVSAGCGGGNFCPSDAVLRSSMAVFLLRAEHGSAYVPPPAVGIFGDVPPSNPFAPWIEEIYNEGITGGCSTNPLEYCPNNPVTRAGMAVFLLRAQHGSSYTPPAAVGIFGDVPASNPFAPWIEQLYTEGITGGCSSNPLLYCPANSVTRAQMAVFLVATFNLQ